MKLKELIEKIKKDEVVDIDSHYDVVSSNLVRRLDKIKEDVASHKLAFAKAKNDVEKTRLLKDVRRAYDMATNLDKFLY